MTGALRRTRLFLIAGLVGVLAAIGAAACGNGSKPINIVQQDDNGGQAAGGGFGANSAFLDCLRSHGVPVPTAFPSRFPRPSGAPRPSFSRRPRPSGFPRPSGSGFRRFFPTAIPSDCASLRPSRPAN